jgi:hypothetical protein
VAIAVKVVVNIVPMVMTLKRVILLRKRVDFLMC